MTHNRQNDLTASEPLPNGISAVTQRHLSREHLASEPLAPCISAVTTLYLSRSTLHLSRSATAQMPFNKSLLVSYKSYHESVLRVCLTSLATSPLPVAPCGRDWFCLVVRLRRQIKNKNSKRMELRYES